MKYTIQLNSKPEMAVEIKHLQLLDSFRKFNDFWNFNNLDIRVPDFGKEIFAACSFNKYLPKAMKGSVFYRYRAGLENTSMHDDYIQFDFNTKHVDFSYLVSTVFPALFTAFDAYFGYIANSELTYVDFKKSREKDLRNELFRLYPIMFIDNDLCNKYIGISCLNIKNITEGYLEKVEVVNNGIYLVSSSNPLTVEESDIIDSSLRVLLKV